MRLQLLAILTATLFAVYMAAITNSSLASEPRPTSEQLEFFEKEVRPLLVEHCYACHSSQAEKIQAGLLLDSRAGLLKGGDSGAAIIPGDVEGSMLIEAVRYAGSEMPPKGKLPAKDIQTLERWVKIGAPWPDEATLKARVARPVFDLAQRKKDHWVWQPLQSPAITKVAHGDWPRNDIDHFILARLEAATLQPAAQADKSALLRRLYFDLIGLPPMPEQAAKYLNDQSPQATEHLVDELLASPHFGERWGRHWLDLVRYAESRGHEFDNDAPNAFQYRDYIIRALNADVPYDQLVREHIAGDLLRQPRLHPADKYNESILGTGFWYLGEWVHSPVDIRKDEADRFDNMLDVMSKTFLGVTVSCARCHDHKFDAISTADYYALSGFLQGSDYRQVRFEALEHNARIAEELAAVDTKYQQKLAGVLAAKGLKPPQPEPIPADIAPLVLVDFETLDSREYRQDGNIFGKQPRRRGTPFVESKDGKAALRFAPYTAAVSDPFWDGLQSIEEKGTQDRSKLAKLPRSGRTLRTPTFTLTSGNVACQVSGAGHVVACVDSHRLIAGPLHDETIKAIGPQDKWVELDLRRYIGHRIHLEFNPAADAQLEVSLVVQGASRPVRDQLSQRQVVSAKAMTKFGQEAEPQLAEVSASLVQSWTEERAKLQTQVRKQSHLAMAMLDGTGEDDHILIRGNSSKPGAVEPRHFLTAVTGGEPMKIPSGSGRLELAEQINAASNPLTSRVIVNRLWHHLLGRGIVATTDDFGVLGERPTHPELLDHLATKFLADGRSIKRMIRYIVLSRTYQLSSHASPTAVAADPKNSLWHHRPPQRMEGEAIRDALLSLSGSLDPTLYGESIPIHLTSFMDGRGRPGKSGPLDGAGRRSIYIAVRRNFLSPLMLTFDTPAPFSSMGRRNVSNVPAQALILMNDPFVVGQVQKWAGRTLAQSSTTEARIASMYQAAYARQPTSQEAAVASEFIKIEATTRGVSESDPKLWADLAHALVNTKEFIYLR